MVILEYRIPRIVFVEDWIPSLSLGRTTASSNNELNFESMSLYHQTEGFCSLI